MSNRRPYVGGNWKMNGRTSEVTSLAGAVAAGIPAGDAVDVVVFPAFPHLSIVGAALAEAPVKLGAQDIYPAEDGAYTGEVSAGMLKEIGVQVVLVGHSERRHVIEESDALIRQKARAVIDAGMELMLCVGETEQQRKEGRTDAVSAAQLNDALEGIGAEVLDRLTIAYEPVWAIGTGFTASAADADSAHRQIRGVLGELFSPAAADAVRILYGGSVKPGNAAELFACNEIDGGLIGGASLDAEAFNAIVAHAAR